jgi:iron complex transport system permease protein
VILLLTGVALNAVAGAGIGFFIFVSDDQQLREFSFWTLGSFAKVGWASLSPAVPLVLLPAIAALALARPLNAFALGEVEAFHLGFAVQHVKRAAIVIVALAVGGSVALAGAVGFVGLVVPHLVRLMVGPDHRILLPASMMLGAALLLGADLLARTIVLPAELPIGVLTSCIGGPFFIWLLLRRRAAEGA